jgi:2'-5' RNA ligase
VDIPDAIKGKVDELLVRLKKRLKNVPLRFVETDNLHLTLKFIGEVSPENAQRIQNLLKTINYSVLNLSFFGGDTFPYGKKEPQVLYLSLGDETLARLVSILELSLKSLGIERDPKAFKGHLTLARVKGRMVPPQVQIFRELTEDFTENFVAREFILYQSCLSLQGPTYKALERYGLEG